MRTSKNNVRGIRPLRDGTFLIRVQQNDPRSGTPVDIRRRVKCGSFAEAVMAQAQLKSEIERGGAQNERVRLEDYARSWLTGRLPTLKPSTRLRYAESLDNHILPELGRFYLDALSPEEIHSWFGKKAAHFSPSTVNGYLRVLKAVMADAAAQYNLPRDPTRRVRAMPKRALNADEPVNLLLTEEVGRFLAALKSRWPQWYAMVFTQLAGALRFGEVTALRWEDIDEQRGILKVRRAQWRTIVSTTKTERPKDVPLTDELRDVLRSWRQELVRSQHRHLNSGWMFPSQVGKPHQNSSCVRKAFVDSLKQIGIDRRLSSHGLRRTANDLLRRVATSEVTRAITGHVTQAMTDHYSHVDLGEKRAAVEGMLQLVWSAGGVSPGCKQAHHQAQADETGTK